MRYVNCRRGEVLAVRIAVVEQSIGFTPDSFVKVGLLRHGEQREAKRIAKIHTGNQRC